MFYILDSYALIGYKGECKDGSKPSWVTQAWHPQPPFHDRGARATPPVRATARISIPACTTEKSEEVTYK